MRKSELWFLSIRGWQWFPIQQLWRWHMSLAGWPTGIACGCQERQSASTSELTMAPLLPSIKAALTCELRYQTLKGRGEACILLNMEGVVEPIDQQAQTTYTSLTAVLSQFLLKCNSWKFTKCLLNFYAQSAVWGTLEWKDSRTKYLALRRIQLIMSFN